MKSHARELTSLARVIYYDACAKCTANKLPDERDIETLMSRVKDEGISFLTITLPDFGSDFEKCLDQGFIVPGCFRSFRKYLKIPAFLQGFFELVFDSGTGGLIEQPDVTAIEGIRQLAYSFKKLKLPCTRFRDNKAIKGFVQCEQDLKESLPQTNLDRFYRVSSVLWSNVFSNTNMLDNILPKHGPGATADGILGNAKYDHKLWHDRLEPYFPILHFAFSSENAMDSENFEHLSVVSSDCEQPVKVITVPKTLKGPRIIAIEPVCMQYTQQGLASNLIQRLEVSPLTVGHINFHDQSVNRSLALSASKNGKLATLDMSSASDRVPRSLALSMFDSIPDFRDAMDACRSTRATLPNGETLLLDKFASMGSALCFPVEAMYFYTLCVLALLESKDLPVTYLNIYKVSRNVYVYGDDIIVPVNEAVNVVDTLQRYYCKANTTKSFWTGMFRESCGMDAYRGEEVTPTYIRQMRPNSMQQSSALISWVETSNHFYKKGYWKTAAHMLRACENVMGVLPIVGERCAGLGKFSYQCDDSNLALIADLCDSEKLHWHKRRWNSHYQLLEIRCWKAVPRYHKDIIDGYPALMKSLLCLLKPQSETEERDKDHMSRSARHGSVALRIRWVRPY